jgi:hypothetical protein
MWLIPYLLRSTEGEYIHFSSIQFNAQAHKHDKGDDRWQWLLDRIEAKPFNLPQIPWTSFC